MCLLYDILCCICIGQAVAAVHGVDRSSLPRYTTLFILTLHTHSLLYCHIYLIPLLLHLLYCILTSSIGVVFTVFFLLNLLVWSYGSTGAVPFLSMVAVLTLWFGISVPLVSTLLMSVSVVWYRVNVGCLFVPSECLVF